MGEDQMKKVFFLAVIAMTCYIAGTYRNTVLLTLAVWEFLLLLVLFFLPYYWKKVLQVGFLTEIIAASKGINQTCRIFVRNKGVLAAGRFRIRMRFGYQYGKKYRVRMFGTAGGTGESQLSFEMDTPYCGLLELELERVRFYDYLSFFSAGKKQKDKMQLLVLPKEQEGLIQENFKWNEKELFLETWRKNGENEQMEVKQLREYQQGDNIRRIHWKQSARMQQLWIKELEQESDSIADLFLELAGEVPTAKEMNCFYQVTAAILLELMQQAKRVAVHWFETAAEKEICIEIWDFISYQQLFCRLYQFDVRTAQEEKEKQLFWRFREEGKCAFRLNRKLEYYSNETFIIKFLEQEFL